MSKTKLLLEVIQDMRTLADSLEALCDAVRSNEPQPEPTESVEEFETKDSKPTFTFEEVRATLAKKSKDGKSADVRALINRYGATKLSDIKQDDYSDVMQEAEAM